jgi:hypothetical protein
MAEVSGGESNQVESTIQRLTNGTLTPEQVRTVAEKVYETLRRELAEEQKRFGRGSRRNWKD